MRILLQEIDPLKFRFALCRDRVVAYNTALKIFESIRRLVPFLH